MATLQGHKAVIGNNETLDHVLAGRARIQAALAKGEGNDRMTPEKKASLEARLADYNDYLQGLKATLEAL